jgi:hypothetical protein
MQRKEAAKGCTPASKACAYEAVGEGGCATADGADRRRQRRRACGSRPANLRRTCGAARSAKGGYREVRLVPDETIVRKGGYVLTKRTKQLLKGRSGLSRPKQVSRRALGALKPRGILARDWSGLRPTPLPPSLAIREASPARPRR